MPSGKIANINRILSAVVFLLAMYALYDFTSHVAPDFAAIIFKQRAGLEAIKSADSKNIAVDSAAPCALKPLGYYTQDIDSKGLFKYSALDNARAQNSSVQFQPLRVKLEELVQTLALKGVVAGDAPQAVIEDTKASKTYFVVKNDKIGDIIVEDIAPNKVKLRLDGESVDLTL